MILFYLLFFSYTGSIGFGNKSVTDLIGRVGELEVDDTHSAAIWASQQPGISADNCFLYGGSHGGFISAHLLTRESSFYRGGVVRNPVINIGSMPYNSDIPDWYIILFN